MNKVILDGIGNSMKHWANYIFDVKRGEILNESAIKFGISEYLVSTGNLYNRQNSGNTGQPRIKEIKFEQKYEIFKKRSADLNFKVCEANNEIDVFFEFKYMKKIPLSKNEMNRYVEDLLRLAALAKQTNDSRNIECYFMLVGESKKIKSLQGKFDDKKEKSTPIKDLPNSEHFDIVKYLFISSQDPKNVILRDLRNNDGSNYLERFNTEYEYCDDVDEEARLKMSDRLSVTLRYESIESTKENINVYIWQVNVQQDG